LACGLYGHSEENDAYPRKTGAQKEAGKADGQDVRWVQALGGRARGGAENRRCLLPRCGPARAGSEAGASGPDGGTDVRGPDQGPAAQAGAPAAQRRAGCDGAAGRGAPQGGNPEALCAQAVDQWYAEATSTTATDVSITNAARAVISQL